MFGIGDKVIVQEEAGEWLDGVIIGVDRSDTKLPYEVAVTPSNGEPYEAWFFDELVASRAIIHIGCVQCSNRYRW